MAADFNAFDASPVPMWVYDPQTLRILEANAAAAMAYGYEREAMRGLTLLDLRPDSEHERLLAHLRRPRGARDEGFWLHCHRDGSHMHVQVQVSDIDYDGRAARLVVARDVSEAERAQARVHLMAQAMSDAAYDWDMTTGRVWFSDSFTINFGFDPAALPTAIDDWTGLVHPDDRSRVTAGLDAAIRAGETYWTDEYAFQRGDGSYTDVLDRGYIQRDGHGRAVRMVGGMIDRRPQRLLSTRLRLLERAVEASASGILIADAGEPSLPVVYANPAFEQITGHAADDIEGRPFDFLQAQDPDPAGQGIVQRALQAGIDVQASLQGRRRDGSAFWYDYRVTPMRDAQGHITHLLGLMTDTSERRQHAQQLQWRATHDLLTGLPNRHCVLERIGALLRDAPQGARVSVLIVDLDEFRLVNDGFGHAAGDRVLVEIGARLRRVLGPAALVGRSTGDEFVVVLEGGDEMQAERVAARVHAALVEPLESVVER